LVEQMLYGCALWLCVCTGGSEIAALWTFQFVQ